MKMHAAIRFAMVVSFATCAVGAAVAGAQTLPAPPPHMLPPVEPGTYREVSITDLSPEARASLLSSDIGSTISLNQTKKIGERGIRKKQGSAQLVQWIDDLLKSVRKDLKPGELNVLLAPASALPANARLLGYFPMGSTVTPPWSKIARAFAIGERTLILEEWDYAHEGGAVLQFSELINTDINGSHGAFMVVMLDDKRAYWKLSWERKGKLYDLSLVEPTYNAGTEALILQIARAVSP